MNEKVKVIQKAMHDSLHLTSSEDIAEFIAQALVVAGFSAEWSGHDKAVKETAFRCKQIVQQRRLSSKPIGRITQAISDEFGV